MGASRGGPRRSFPAAQAARALASLIAAAALAAALTSCGIETVKIYSAPVLTEDGGLLTLKHDSDNDSEPSFLGYEIYYHIYDDTEENASKATADRAAVEALAAQEDATPDKCLDKLASLGFKRFKNSDGNDNRPLFTIGTDNVFKIGIPSSADWYFYRSLSDPLVPANLHAVSRWISEPSSIVSFVSPDGYDPSDSDYIGSNILINGEINVVFFAVAYGFDFTSVTTIESLPASTYKDISVTISP